LHTRATKLREKIAGVTSVLRFSAAAYGGVQGLLHGAGCSQLTTVHMQVRCLLFVHRCNTSLRR